MDVLIIILLVAALVCFLIAAFEVVVSRVNLIALGLALWVGAVLVQTVH